MAEQPHDPHTTLNDVVAPRVRQAMQEVEVLKDLGVQSIGTSDGPALAIVLQPGDIERFIEWCRYGEK